MSFKLKLNSIKSFGTNKKKNDEKRREIITFVRPKLQSLVLNCEDSSML